MIKAIKKTVLILCMVCTISSVNAKGIKSTNDQVTNNTNEKDAIHIGELLSLNNDHVHIQILSPQEMIDEINSDVYLNEKDKINSTISIYSSMFSRSTSYGYLTLTFDVPVTSTYKPQVKFYTKFLYYNDPAPYQMVNIMNVSLKRDYNGIVKQFNGTIYYNLENGKTLYYILNGDFYNTGTTTVGSGVQIGIGEHSNITFSVSNQSNFYAYKYYDERYIAAGLYA